MKRRVLVLAVAMAVLAVPVAAVGRGSMDTRHEVFSTTSVTEPGTSDNLKLVGHSSLRARGMNAAPAMYKNFLYVGNRTDGSAGHERAGVLVVNIGNPRHPRVIGEIGPPHEGTPSQSSRELRVWPEKKLLIVMNFACSTFIHACAAGEDVWDFKFYDLSGSNARHPKLIATYESSYKPHEMFLWEDPEQPGRALLYISVPHSSESPNDDTPNLLVTDISKARQGAFQEVASFTANPLYTSEDIETKDVALHSMSVSVDGSRTYLAYLGGGFLILNSSEVAAGSQNPRFQLLTPVTNSPMWPNQTVHSAVKVFGRDLVVATDEIYGDLLDDFAFEDHGCPWGWAHFIDTSDETRPELVGEYKLEENTDAYCEGPSGQDPANTYFTSYSAHNPTMLRRLGITTWHSGGVQVFDLADPTVPRQTGFFSPEPLEDVDTEDPALSQGLNKVVMWSYPIIRNGLIYLIDVRNGLYVLRYTGPGRSEIDGVDFLEGNSTLGDAARLEH
ncbi:MAG: hypothetical protein M3456_02130 [Actinomycetota bacterium]|nr:hypothetical protein [Actinomycetota bacterium]